ncbi:MAG: DUF2220 family protein [Eubacteriales bacterium]|nr:DUF2220 family protein [Eubacteriales bacterium]
MIVQADQTILNSLLDKYEASKRFSGQNKIERKILVKVATLFPQYQDHANFEDFSAINDAVDHLSRARLVEAKRNRANNYSEIQLSLDSLAEAYQYLDRTPKSDIHAAIMELLVRYQGRNEVLDRFCLSQIERIQTNKTVSYYNDDLLEFEHSLMAVVALFQIPKETFARDFSVQVFKDSKVFDRISSKVVSLLFEYGDFPEKEQVLSSLNLIKNPTYVNFKGSGVIILKGQLIDLSVLPGDIAISSELLPDIEVIKVKGNIVMTIENLTSFHIANGSDHFLIYLGGFHNQVRRDFIQKLHTQNPAANYFHFGDIDAGGFQILQHLRRQTGIDFNPWRMDLETLVQYKSFCRELTENDRHRLSQLLGQGFDDIIFYMLEHNVKLEQEAVR